MWILKYSRPANIQFDELIRGQGLAINPYFPGLIKSVICLPAGHGFMNYYFDDKEFQNLMEKGAAYILREKNYYSTNKKMYARLSTLYLKAGKKFLKNLTSLNNQALLKLYLNYTKATKKMWFFFYSPWFLNEVIEPEFRKEIEVRYPKQADFILKGVGGLTRELRYDRQLKELLKYKLKGKLTKERLKAHTQKWGYLNIYVPQHKPYTAADFKKMIRDINPTEKLKAMEKSIKENRKNYNKTLKLLIKNKKLFNLAKLINYYVFLRNERVDIYREVIALSKLFYDELDKRLGLKNCQSSFMLEKEIINFLKRDIRPNLSEIKKRAKTNYGWYFKKGKGKLILNAKGIKQIYYKEIKKGKKIKKFSGTVAYRAEKLIIGRVKIIISPKQKTNFKKGNILVTAMTNPEYFVLMRKSAAIITDEGGIACHAAILSRELKKPCIIGTKIATKVLKDGDLVEVDAEAGVVKKIKSLPVCRQGRHRPESAKGGQ